MDVDELGRCEVCGKYVKEETLTEIAATLTCEECR